VKNVLTACAVSALLAAAMAMPAGAQNTQQQKMTTCNAMAGQKNLSGDARKAFMSDCLSGKTPAAAPMTQQEKMTFCNKDASAKNLSGDARKAFMSSCLKG
jgi:hypothetical protein